MNLEQIITSIKEASEISVDVLNSFESEEEAKEFLKDLFAFIQAKTIEEYIEKIEEMVKSIEKEELSEIISKIIEIYKNIKNQDPSDEEIEGIVYSLVALKNTLEDLDENDENDKKLYEMLNTILAEEKTLQNVVEEKKESSSKEKDRIKIVSSKEKVSTTAQGKVDKEKLKNDIMMALEENIPGAKEALYEIFALVKCEDKKECQKYPHHEFDGENVILNPNGLVVATIFFAKPQNQKLLSEEEKMTMAKHLAKHYEELGKEIPSSLKRILDKKESFVDFDMSIEDLYEISSKYNISVEELGTYLTTIEVLISEMINNGFVDVESDLNEIILKLSKDQVEKIVSLMDKVNVNLFKVLNGEEVESDVLSKEYAKEIEELKSKLNEAISTAVKYKEEVEYLNKELSKYEAIAEKVESLKKEKEVLENKLNLLVNVYKKSEEYDETMLNMILEASDEKEIMILRKLSESATNPKLKFSKLTGDDIDLFTGSKYKEKKESTKLKDYIANLL